MCKLPVLHWIISGISGARDQLCLRWNQLMGFCPCWLPAVQFCKKLVEVHNTVFQFWTEVSDDSSGRLAFFPEESDEMEVDMSPFFGLLKRLRIVPRCSAFSSGSTSKIFISLAGRSELWKEEHVARDGFHLVPIRFHRCERVRGVFQRLQFHMQRYGEYGSWRF